MGEFDELDSADVGNWVVRNDYTDASYVDMANVTRCVDTTGYDVVDLDYVFVQQVANGAVYIRALYSTDGNQAPWAIVNTVRFSLNPGTAVAWNADDTYLDFFSLQRLTDINSNVANNANVCVSFDLRSPDTYVYLDNVCIDGTTFNANMFTLGSPVTDNGAGNYDFDISASQRASVQVECVWDDGPGGYSAVSSSGLGIDFTP